MTNRKSFANFQLVIKKREKKVVKKWDRYYKV